jgi:hypothetical protein
MCAVELTLPIEQFMNEKNINQTIGFQLGKNKTKSHMHACMLYMKLKIGFNVKTISLFRFVISNNLLDICISASA